MSGWKSKGTGLDWFEATPFPDRIFRIREPALAPLHGSNAWLIQGRKASLLVDTGIGVAPLRPFVATLCPGPILCLLTHTHYDHIGGAHEFDERLAHRAEAGVLADPNPVATQWRGWLSADSFAFFPKPDFEFGRYAILPAEPSRLIEDGARIDLGDRVLTALHSPGHSPGLITVFEEATGALFTSDALYDGRMFFDLAGSNAQDAARSIRRLRALDPDIAHPGHFDSLRGDGFRALADRTLAQWE
jgi:glyoxylase-like metal-dependent hydrolase (beta-lactamase superfamily II)